MLLISDYEYISYLVQMMEEIALEKEEEVKDNFSEKNNACDQLLENVNRDNTGTEIEATETEEIPFQTNSTDPDTLNITSDAKTNDSNKVHSSASSETNNSELLQSAIVKLKVLENQNTELICESEDQKKVIDKLIFDSFVK